LDLPDEPGGRWGADRVRIHDQHKEKLMAIWGADVEQLRTLGSKLQHGANEIEQQRTNLTSLLNQTDWKGPDADKFKAQWNGEHTSLLNKVAEALKDAGQKAKRNAEEQSNASQGGA
jgi:hypothetical protein